MASILDQMSELTEATATKPPRLRQRTIRLDDGHRVGLSVCGEGVPLVMVHGVIAEGMLYARTLRRLAAAGFRVIAVDSAGHGRTDGLGRDGWTLARYVDLHDRVLDHLGIERAVFMGHSMGGRIVCDLAERRPERAIAVIPINAAIGRTWDRLTGIAPYAGFLFPLAFGVLASDTALSAIRGRAEMGNLARLAAPTLLDRIRSAPSLPGALWAIGTARDSIGVLERIGGAGVPVIVVNGDWDLAVWWPNATQAAKAAGGHLVRVRNGLHSWMLENADSLPSLVGTMLEGPLGDALARRADSIEACYGPEAIALTIDRPRSKPYQLEPAHDFELVDLG